MTDPKAPHLLRFKRLTIEGLFGVGAPLVDIPFNLEERVTVLHGRNGSGKTISLNLINAVRHGDLTTLARYPFSKLTVEFDSSAKLVVTQLSPSEGKKEAQQFVYSIYEEGSMPFKSRMTVGRRPEKGRIARTEIAMNFPWLDQIGPDLWRDSKTGSAVSSREAFGRYGDQLGLDFQREFLGLDTRLATFLERLPKVKFIRTDRLFVRNVDSERIHRARPDRFAQSDAALMVDRLSADLRDEVQSVDRAYRLISTQLDSSLRRRLFEKPENPSTVAELKTGNKNLDAQEQKLMEMGLLKTAPDSVDAETIAETERDQHSILLQDRKEKLAVFTTIVAKAQHLLESLNKKLAPKKVRLNVENGYEVRTLNGEVLPLESLSSGEQHELVLLHELLFDVPVGSLILIDEPELSLHVTWQMDLLPELLEIAKLTNLDFLLATHSPYIVGDRNDLMVRLGEPV